MGISLNKFHKNYLVAFTFVKIALPWLLCRHAVAYGQVVFKLEMFHVKTFARKQSNM